PSRSPRLRRTPAPPRRSPPRATTGNALRSAHPASPASAPRLRPSTATRHVPAGGACRRGSSSRDPLRRCVPPARPGAATSSALLRQFPGARLDSVQQFLPWLDELADALREQFVG